VSTTTDYINQLPEERKETIKKLVHLFRKSLPIGFEETMSYGMVGFVVPKSSYPNGYHCDKSLPLPFINIGSQKNFIGLYHMGLYANQSLFSWFTEEYDKRYTAKLDMGKSCIRFKKAENIPWELLDELATKMTVAQWITLYEAEIKK
jgi:uncharacterized protein YdhG (YjbR/CyaY superfamily)